MAMMSLGKLVKNLLRKNAHEKDLVEETERDPLAAANEAKAAGKNKGGRPKGSKSKTSVTLNTGTGELKARSQEFLERAMLEGELPIEFLLKVMRNEKNPMRLRMQAATTAAPYIHPKLAFIQQENNNKDATALQKIISALESEKRLIHAKRIGKSAPELTPAEVQAEFGHSTVKEMEPAVDQSSAPPAPVEPIH